MGNVLPQDHIFPQAPSLFNWNYATYLGDGIPLLFWVFINPYTPCSASNDYKWQIYTSQNKTVPFQYGKADNGANSFLKFPSTNSYQSNILYSTTRGNTLGPYRGNCAVIVVDSPWARSCDVRQQTNDADKNKNYAVGVSTDMLYRITNTYNTWDKWFNTQNYPGLGGLSTCTPGGTNTPRSLLPSYLKNAIIAATNNSSNGGVSLVDVLGWKPAPAGYAPNTDQAGMILPEVGGVDVHLLATQCHIDNNYDNVNPFAKTFIGAFVAIYKDYDVQDVIINNSLLINVPWSGMLTGAGRDIDYPNYQPIPQNNIYKMNVPKAAGQCTLNCPQDLTFDPLYDLYYVASSDTNTCYDGAPTNYFPGGSPSWSYDYTAPFTWPRFAQKNTSDINLNPVFGTFENPNIFYDGLGEAFPCGFKSYNIQSAGAPINYNLSTFPPFNNPTDLIAPWWQKFTMSDFTRQLVAGGGCSNSIMNLF
jgi:hypothetical protein